MGCSASCHIFETLSNALEWIVTQKINIPHVAHILDDFLLLDSRKQSLQHKLDTFLAMLKDIGIHIAPDKPQAPTQVLTFLGFKLDSLNMEIRLPINLTIGVKKPYHYVRVTREFRQDLMTWLTFLVFQLEVVIASRSMATVPKFKSVYRRIRHHRVRDSPRG